MKSSLMIFYKLAKSRYHKKRGQATFLLNPYRRIHTDTIKKLLDDKIIEKIEPNLYIFVILNIGSTMFDYYKYCLCLKLSRITILIRAPSTGMMIM
jgi:hypothetical protein